MVYGVRLGGDTVRRLPPSAFLQSSLELGLWMNAVTLVAWWFWRTGQLKQLGGLGGGAIVAAADHAAIACKTTTATLLFFAGTVALWLSWRTKTKWALWGLLAIAPIYYAVRITDTWSGRQAVELVRLFINQERAHSLEYRLDNEDLLIAKALHRPYLGWGGWGRNLVYEESKGCLASSTGVGDRLGTNGCVGGFDGHGMPLAGSAVPQAFPSSSGTPSRATVIAVVVDLYLLDGLFNGMISVIYVIAAGGVQSRSGPCLATALRKTGGSLRSPGRS
jgi:hypothetical protein